MKTEFRAKGLLCGCCGQHFTTWEEYVDQGQDKGYGTCYLCQREAERKEVEMVEEAFKKVYEAVNGKNKARMDKITEYDDRKAFVLGAIDQGILEWKIGR